MQRLEATARRTTRSEFALLRLGFRPFYLMASLFAALSTALWVAQYTGALASGYLKLPAWHGHEMLFGYTIAVVAGFLLTAVRNWTGQPTPTGWPLAVLALLWLAGRVMVLTPYGLASALVNAAFPLGVAVGIGLPLTRSGNRRNYFFLVLLLLLAAATFVLHLSLQGRVELPARASLQVGLDVVLFVMAVMGGRVIPMFTNNGVPGAGAVRKPWLERLALGGVLLLLAIDLVLAPAAMVGGVALAVALVHAARLSLWRPWRTLRTPLVWVLHAAYAWIVVHLVLRSLSAFGAVSDLLSTHALTIGAIGGLTIGMMTRTARGHTGRPLAADRFEVTCYLLVLLAAIVRVFGGMLLPDRYPGTLVVSGGLWSLAFLIYFVRYWPVLTRPRIDGKPG